MATVNGSNNIANVIAINAKYGTLISIKPIDNSGRI
jgi:hypothetical protein